MTTIDGNGCIEFGPRSKTCPSWPVRVVGMQGLWRYVGPIIRKSPNGILDSSAELMIEVIGPFFPGNPSRNGGRSRIFNLSKLKYAGKHAKPVDVLSVEATAISLEAKRARRR